MRFNELPQILGQPYYETPACLIFNLDCLQALQSIQSRFVNLTITSPPYNIGKEYENVLPLADYLAWCQQWMAEIHRLTCLSGAFWLNLGYLSIPKKGKAIPLPYLLWDRVPFFLVQEVVWNYGAGVAGRKFFSPRNEKFLWYVKDEKRYTFNLDHVRDPNVKYPNQKKNGKNKVNPLGKNPTDVWQVPKVTSGKNRSAQERTPHPAQFPRELINRVIKACSNEHELILDPFMGSGTTAVEALNLGRQVVGFEINADYCQIAADRIDNFLTSN